MASSCVPASSFESPRRPLLPGDLEGLLRRRRVLGLAEMMNFPGVISGSPAELEKLALPGATHVDGHAPHVLGKELNAYAAAGIRSDHEMSTIEEGRERLRAGFWVLIREASGARNLHALLPLVEEFGPHRLAFCTDDREPEHIAEEGHINSMVREAVKAGVAPEDALVMASFNPATWHGLRDFGALAPGYRADVLVLGDLESFMPETVLKGGKEVGEIEKPEVPGVGQAHGPHPPAGDERLRDPVGGERRRPRHRDRPGPDRHRLARGGAEGRERARGGRSGARPAQDRRRRAAPRHRPRRARARARLRSAERRPGLDGRARRPQHRRRRGQGRRHPAGRAAALGHRRRSGGRGRRDRPRGAEAAGGGPALGREPRGGDRLEPRLRRGGALPRLRARLAVPVDGFPGAVRDPEPEDHRPRARGRRPLRARPARRRDDAPPSRPRRHDGRRRHRARGRLGADRRPRDPGGRGRRAPRGGRADRPRRRGRRAGARQHPSPPVPNAHARPSAGGRPLHLAEDAVSDLGAHRRRVGVRRRTNRHGRAGPVRLLDRLRPPLHLPPRANGPGRGAPRGGAVGRRQALLRPWLDGPRRIQRRSAARLARRRPRHDPVLDRDARQARHRHRRRAVLAVLRDERADARVREAGAKAGSPASHAPRRDRRGGGVLPRALRLHACGVPRGARLARGRRLVRALRPPRRPRGAALRRHRDAASRTAPPRICGSAPASRRSGTSSTPAARSASAWTAPRRTSAATCSSR